MSEPPQNVSSPSGEPIDSSKLNQSAAETISGQLPPSALQGPSLIAIVGYHVVREVSRGGQAVVCEAIQQSTGRKVAIKLMREGPLASARERARFDREVQVLAALNHPNIVRVVDRGTTADGSFFLVMDYIGGPPLDEWLAAYYRTTPTARLPAIHRSSCAPS